MDTDEWRHKPAHMLNNPRRRSRPRYDDDDTDSYDSPDDTLRVRVQHVNSGMSRFPSFSNQMRRSRQLEESPEEMALRRRRREAMVLNEGDRPVSQDDIIQRQGGGQMTEEETRAAESALEDITRAAME
jgi:hypothetical protein